MKAKTVYEATDGKQFESADECLDHEKTSSFKALVGLMEAEVVAMIDGSYPALQRALFDAYNEAQRRRREDGKVRKRAPKQAATQPAQAAA